MGVVMAKYKDGFDGVGSLVDVGGGTGGMIAEIVKSHPHIRGINFDLPHVVATAPWVLHDWGDEDCIKILWNCRKAIPEKRKKGRLIIVDIVLEKDSHDLFDETRMVFDLSMMAHTASGKEKTELEWKEILKEGGFPRYKINKIPTIPSIIEAYPI
ncbi:(R,S)-reticuline 7-O-methyltransferase [Morella rubra]|uniref:(R,S)-reticuline 7-O-methyltransferase n=1 Tax=Morella rubra TaxID=262757 RepID=A0A6A1V052_9ROSI|nr:(R,S)-reticuline 7-O-methyltransferase [Morella rubra]